MRTDADSSSYGRSPSDSNDDPHRDSAPGFGTEFLAGLPLHRSSASDAAEAAVI